MACVGMLQEEARKRKDRLKSLKSKRGPETDDNEPPEKKGAGDGEKLPKPVFRSYKPRDESLKANRLPQANPVEVKEKVKEQLDASKPGLVVEEVDLINLAPRKPDWDLKRDVAKKLEKLDRRTQRAIAELIRERLQAGQDDLAGAVNAVGVLPQDEED